MIAAKGDAIDKRMAQKAKEGDALRAVKRKVWDFQAQEDKQQALVAKLRMKMIAAHQRIAELDTAQAADLAFVQTRQPPAAKSSTPTAPSGSAKGKSLAATTSSSSASPPSLPGAKGGK